MSLKAHIIHIGTLMLVCLLVPLVEALRAPSCEKRAPRVRREDLIGYSIILFLAAARLVISLFVPFPDQTGHEELLTGAIIHGMFENPGSRPPLDYLFTHIVSGSAFLSGHNTLFHLRLPGQIFAAVSLLFMAHTLRMLGCRWTTVLVSVGIAATLRLFIIAAGITDDIYAGVPIFVIFIWAVVGIERGSEKLFGFYCAAAGLLCGVMIYEYPAYKLPAFLYIPYWVLITLQKCREKGARKCWKAALFPMFLIAVLFPLIQFELTSSNHSYLFENWRRHRGERTGLVGPNFLRYFGGYLSGMAGLSIYDIPELRASYDNNLPLYFLLLCPTAAVYSMFFGGRLHRFLILTAVLIVAGGAAFSNSSGSWMILPSTYLVLVLASVGLEKLVLRSGLFETTAYPPLLLGIFGLILWTHFCSYHRFLHDPSTRSDWARDHYPLCAAMAKRTSKGDNVSYLRSPDGLSCDYTTDGKWLLPSDLRISALDELPPESELTVNQWLFIGLRRHHQSDSSSYDDLVRRLKALPHGGSFQVDYNLVGTVEVLSLCYRCT